MNKSMPSSQICVDNEITQNTGQAQPVSMCALINNLCVLYSLTVCSLQTLFLHDFILKKYRKYTKTYKFKSYTHTDMYMYKHINLCLCKYMFNNNIISSNSVNEDNMRIKDMALWTT